MRSNQSGYVGHEKQSVRFVDEESYRTTFIVKEE